MVFDHVCGCVVHGIAVKWTRFGHGRGRGFLISWGWDRISCSQGSGMEGDGVCNSVLSASNDAGFERFRGHSEREES